TSLFTIAPGRIPGQVPVPTGAAAGTPIRCTGTPPSVQFMVSAVASRSPAAAAVALAVIVTATAAKPIVDHLLLIFALLSASRHEAVRPGVAPVVPNDAALDRSERCEAALCATRRRSTAGSRESTRAAASPVARTSQPCVLDGLDERGSADGTRTRKCIIAPGIAGRPGIWAADRIPGERSEAWISIGTSLDTPRSCSGWWARSRSRHARRRRPACWV